MVVTREESSENPGVAEMNDALLAEYNAIQPLVLNAERQEVEARYAIAAHYQKVREGEGTENTYGARAVARLARALGLSKSHVYADAAVAEKWPDVDRFRELATRQDKFGRPLSWSHVVLLATVADGRTRESLIRKVLREGWRVRELKKELKRRAAEASAEASQTGGPSASAQPLTAAVEDLASQAAAFKRTAVCFSERLREQVQNAEPAELDDSFVGQLRRVREDAQQALRLLDDCLAQSEERTHEDTGQTA